ncbi:MAG: helix-turn-helix transcriptional regulator [Desulfobulbus sp.]|nr:helix-turn-helix transcriptional regulator [Desulfobulbus sp.]
MGREGFIQLRVKLGKTQKALAELLGVSLKAVQSYEQGWRSIPFHVERQLYFLAANQQNSGQPSRKDCWAIKRCVHKKECSAWEFQAGRCCWFHGSTRGAGAIAKDWKEKMTICRKCEVLASLF